VDIPSGLDCDSGMPLGVSVSASVTLTIGAMKTGFLNSNSKKYTGEVDLIDAGFPRNLLGLDRRNRKGAQILDEMTRLEKDADKIGFRWENPYQIMDQIESECHEIRHELEVSYESEKNKKLQEEIGDIFHAVFSLCVFCDFSPEQTLKNTTDKFARRLQAVKRIAIDKGLESLHGFSFKELMKIWDQAKIVADHK